MLALLGLLLAAFAMAMWVGGRRPDPAPLTEQARPSPDASSTNADLLAFTDGKAGGLYVRDMRSGEMRLLAPDASDMRFQGALSGAIDGRAAWSPNREEIAYFAEGGSLRVVRVADGASREVAQTEPLSAPWGFAELLAWSPDGSWIVTPTTIREWTPGTGQSPGEMRVGLMLVNVHDPSRSVVLSSDDTPAAVAGSTTGEMPALDWSAFAGNPGAPPFGWAPSGRTLALVGSYQVGGGTSRDPYVVLIDASGSGSRAIRVPKSVSYAAWIDEEHLLVSDSPEDPSRRSLSVLDLPSGQMTQLIPDLSDDPEAIDLVASFPAVSPDRSLIAFYAGRGLVVIDTEGEVLHQFKVGSCSGGREMALDFSISGRQVLMQCMWDGWRIADLDSDTVRDVDLGGGFANW